MSATYRDKSAIVTGGNTALATLNVTIPGTIQNGDMGFLCLAWVVPGTEETPTVSGWTGLYGTYQAQGTLRWLVFYRQYQTGDSATVTVTFVSGIGKLINAQAYWWSGSDGTMVLGSIGTRAASGGTDTNTAPSVTTTAANQTVVVVSVERTTATETDITSLSLGTERSFVPDSGSTICTIMVADFVQVTQGATPAVNVVYPNTQALNGAAIQIVIPEVAVAGATLAWIKA
ncbi:MAG TPA: hypothetical protein VH144_02590 [Candidatus Saccharimonadales bacterium]|jgi:hypothetical protein|nr:hypothetical protein [Candidatus Saccharimonadales bacterium]